MSNVFRRFGRSSSLVGLLWLTFFQSLAIAALLPPGFRPVPPGVHALVGGRVVVKPGEVIERGTLVVRDGIITEVGPTESVVIPVDARVWSLNKQTVYAGFIDPYLVHGERDAAPVSSLDEQTLEEETKHLSLTSTSFRFYGTADSGVDMGHAGPGYQNENITPEFRVAREYSPSEKVLAPLRELGFAAGLIVPGQGIIRGSSALVLLEPESPNRVIVRPDVFQHVAFEIQRSENRAFPVSLMGVIASVRQSFMDAAYYGLEQEAWGQSPLGRKRPDYNAALEALLPAASKKMPVLFEPGSALMVDRAARVANELGLEFSIVSSGQEWRRPDLARATGALFVVPLDFPELPKMPGEDDWEQVRLDALRSWDWAPENAALLRREGVEVALTTHGLSEKKKFRQNLALALARGLSETDALAALTTVPARLCGVDKQLGTIERGKMANLAVVEGKSYFDREAKVRVVWIEGRPYRNAGEEPNGAVAEKPGPTARPNEPPGTPEKEEPEKQPKPPSLATKEEATDLAESKISREKNEGADQIKQDSLEIRKKRVARSPLADRGPLAQPTWLIVTNATIWTCGPEGVLTNADLLVHDGKIEAVGANLRGRVASAPDLVSIKGTGLHLTPGLIDAHSHTAILGSVNESALPSSAMVRISDVVNSETDNIYQQLAGGLTIANLLHGSANPIGGQNCVIKLRLGASPEDLVFKAAPRGIKFALGENPKQANWGPKFVTRFPQTRMGVRTFIANRFTAAQQYLAEWEKCRSSDSIGQTAIPPRRDLELEAIGQIIQGQRWIYCHAYRQDEILMMMRLMESFGVKIGSFEHVLEGYKVADEIALHGAAASTFSDWWAYKFEVYDAIPYNGSLLRERGALAVFNSDSSEMARRMNSEAAKAVKFGGTPEVEALKFVTINPAKQLRIDSRVGSLEPGKDADFALWSRAPLDSTTHCLQTWIEGKKYFDYEQARERAIRLEKERFDLLAKAKRLAKSGSGASGDPAGLTFFRGCLEQEHEGEDRGCHHEE